MMGTKYRLHITIEGERWDNIAWRYYGDPYLYPLIIAANPHVAITAALSSGIRLAIPIIERPKTTRDLPPWLQ
ncbi:MULTISPECIES: tail protein X [Yersinia pseudotuberculosis complex]|uniref:tail protein X n=1 Tax=Yersinia pseudotuberculosis complex TaxID=1649845 RepID=UPI0009B8D3E1|nr:MULTISPECIES: tail protein X [Yersinia pseudotuberculosis complex]MBO1548752.1 hypothetical protein [Yersinia pseudotuberculosis]MBO1561856.1 hypothetical protein [Yersinia pseudotuberculosis]MBO1568969.1 hypothetical protein [Yersinia pseudotuberculosis]MBO1583700.1 hypothetical protein [Yersinia pseudotuberculosis]MBO1633671.1 hypothetical protein [Yersinia pseudotuberculosis]